MFSCKFCEIFEHLRTAASGVLKTFQDIFYGRPPTDRFWYNHCVKSVQIRSLFWSVFPRIQTEYGAIDYTSVFSPNTGKCRTRKNSVSRQFHAVNVYKVSAISKKNLPTLNNTKDMYASSYRVRECSVREGVLRNFTKFTGKHLCQCLFF